MARLTGKTVLISGAARGLGAACARALADEGAGVVIGDLLEAEGRRLSEELGDSAHYVYLDVTDADAWRTAVTEARQTFGGLDVLVNNAGIAVGAPLEEHTLDQWNGALAVNLTGTFLGMRAAVPALRERGGGSIVNVSSVEGLRGSAGLHGYVAAKFGVRGLTKSAAVELGRHGIRVNSVHPGFVRTAMTENLDPEVLQIPLGRAAEPGDVAPLVVFLAADDSAYCTGAEFVVDGGLVSGVPHSG
ncbi:glucose 1-dehydrogenase [Thermobifida halotolerans]|uniref:Glucose 1-dehydrogenase n=1 Tax=Thermobifida halotolerans TaxID=483545 RepID=A0AA97M2Y7_9ACTN|nr:glucose 1-dehydrogenase [Thermobifida halotolerans]UOE18623.1 glucose 1-dehydrogenase [Thermobifida halotolerans]